MSESNMFVFEEEGKKGTKRTRAARGARTGETTNNNTNSGAAPGAVAAAVAAINAATATTTSSLNSSLPAVLNVPPTSSSPAPSQTSQPSATASVSATAAGSDESTGYVGRGARSKVRKVAAEKEKDSDVYGYGSPSSVGGASGYTSPATVSAAASPTSTSTDSASSTSATYSATLGGFTSSASSSVSASSTIASSSSVSASPAATSDSSALLAIRALLSAFSPDATLRLTSLGPSPANYELQSALLNAATQQNVKGYVAVFHWEHYAGSSVIPEKLLALLPTVSEVVSSIPALVHRVVKILYTVERLFRHREIYSLLDKRLVKPEISGNKNYSAVNNSGIPLHELLLTDSKGNDYTVYACRKEHVKLIFEDTVKGVEGGALQKLGLCRWLLDIYSVVPGKLSALAGLCNDRTASPSEADSSIYYSCSCGTAFPSQTLHYDAAKAQKQLFSTPPVVALAATATAAALALQDEDGKKEQLLQEKDRERAKHEDRLSPSEDSKEGKLKAERDLDMDSMDQDKSADEGFASPDSVVNSIQSLSSSSLISSTSSSSSSLLSSGSASSLLDSSALSLISLSSVGSLSSQQQLQQHSQQHSQREFLVLQQQVSELSDALHNAQNDKQRLEHEWFESKKSKAMAEKQAEFWKNHWQQVKNENVKLWTRLINLQNWLRKGFKHHVLPSTANGNNERGPVDGDSHWFSMQNVAQANTVANEEIVQQLANHPNALVNTNAQQQQINIEKSLAAASNTAGAAIATGAGGAAGNAGSNAMITEQLMNGSGSAPLTVHAQLAQSNLNLPIGSAAAAAHHSAVSVHPSAFHTQMVS